MRDVSVATPGRNGKQDAVVETDVSGLCEQVPDAEVVVKAKRRRFTKQYKLRILKQVDACTRPGEIGAVLRREGLYSSYVSKWRMQRDQGQLETKKRGRPAADPSQKQLARLRVENARLSKKLEQAEAIIEVQKKLSDLLGLNNDNSERAEDT